MTKQVEISIFWFALIITIISFISFLAAYQWRIVIAIQIDHWLGSSSRLTLTALIHYILENDGMATADIGKYPSVSQCEIAQCSFHGAVCHLLRVYKCCLGSI